MMDASRVIEASSNLIRRTADFEPFIEKVSKLSEEDFRMAIESKNFNDRKNLEQFIVSYQTMNMHREPFTRFANQYNQYLCIKLEKDPRTYLTNDVCKNFISTFLQEKENNTFINGKSITEIMDIVKEQQKILFNKIDNNQNLDFIDQSFLAESFIIDAYTIGIDNQEMRYVEEYFKKFPIKDLESIRNRQLELLLIFSKRRLFLKEKIYFTPYSIHQNKSHFSAKKDGSVEIVIDQISQFKQELDESYFSNIFVLLHELRHEQQSHSPQIYSTEDQDRIKMEKQIIGTNHLFYRKYHDSFFTERDADDYAALELTKEYSFRYPTLVSTAIKKWRNQRHKINDFVFYKMEMHEYLKYKVDRLYQELLICDEKLLKMESQNKKNHLEYSKLLKEYTEKEREFNQLNIQLQDILQELQEIFTSDPTVISDENSKTESFTDLEESKHKK